MSKSIHRQVFRLIALIAIRHFRVLSTTRRDSVLMRAMAHDLDRAADGLGRLNLTCGMPQETNGGSKRKGEAAASPS
jgi:hypothetical protein